MTPAKISARIVLERLDWAERMLLSIQKLPLDTPEHFFSASQLSDPQRIANALRRWLNEHPEKPDKTL